MGRRISILEEEVNIDIYKYGTVYPVKNPCPGRPYVLKKKVV